MRRVVVMGLLLLAAAPRAHPAQGDTPSAFPTASGPSRPVQVEDAYMRPLPVTLEEISSGLRKRQSVRTRATLEFLEPGEPGYYLLREGTVRVVVIPLPEIAPTLRALLGRRVEVAGYVRELERAQGTCRYHRNVVPQSICDDPALPPKPDLDRADRANWPTMSITVWSGNDATLIEKSKVGESLGDVLDSAGREAITAVGRFCGANLCGELAPPAPIRDAWVLTDGNTAIWVVGQPKGAGFSLDPTYKGDTWHWLEVKGHVKPCGSVRCLYASSVKLKAPPAGEEPAD